MFRQVTGEGNLDCDKCRAAEGASTSRKELSIPHPTLKREPRTSILETISWKR